MKKLLTTALLLITLSLAQAKQSVTVMVCGNKGNQLSQYYASLTIIDRLKPYRVEKMFSCGYEVSFASLMATEAIGCRHKALEFTNDQLKGKHPDIVIQFGNIRLNSEYRRIRSQAKLIIRP